MRLVGLVPDEERNKRPARRKLAQEQRLQTRRGKPSTNDRAAALLRDQFLERLLDRAVTRQQAIDALTRPPSSEPGKPGGLGMSYSAASAAWTRALQRRRERFRRESAHAREDQGMRLLAHVSGAVANKQYGALGALEDRLMRLHGTAAPLKAAPPRGDRRDLIADALAGMSDEEIRELAGEEDPSLEDEE